MESLLNLSCHVGGEFTFNKIIDGEEVPIFQSPSKNMILDTWISFMSNISGNTETLAVNPSITEAMLKQCKLGTGDTPVSPSDMGLSGTLLATIQADTSLTQAQAFSASYNPVDDIITCELTRKFNATAGAIIGTFKEITVESTYGVTCRALVLDGDGNPSSVTLTATDQLSITYKFKLKFKRSTSIVIDVDGTPTTVSVLFSYSNLHATDGTYTGTQPPDFSFWNYFKSFQPNYYYSRSGHNNNTRLVSDINHAVSSSIGYNDASVTTNILKQKISLNTTDMTIKIFSGRFYDTDNVLSKIAFNSFGGNYMFMTFTPHIQNIKNKTFKIRLRRTIQRL